jgi:hypothetical protein
MPNIPLPDTDATVTNTPNTPTPAPAPAPDTSAPAATPAATTQPAAQQTQQPNSPVMVSNAQGPPTPSADSTHPLVQHASLLRQAAQAMAGGPQYQTTVDADTGQITKTEVPLTKTQIGMAIALSAIQGGLTGMSQVGPGSAARGGAMAFDQAQKQQQQIQQQRNADAQQDLRNQTSALTRKAQAFETNSRTVLNTAQAERMGLDNLKDAVKQNASLLQSYDEAGEVQESNISQDALKEGIASGKYSSTGNIAVPDGFTTINGRPEQTFSVIRNPSTKVNLDQATWDVLASGGAQGFTKGTKIPANGFPITGSMLAIANQQVQANSLMKQEVGQVTSALVNSKDKNYQELGQSIPDIGKMLSDPQTGPTLQNALSKAQRWMSHSQHGNFYESLQAMSQPSMPNPQNPSQMVPNTYGPALANTIYGAIGNGDPARGQQILKAYHDAVTPVPIKNVAQAESIASDHTSSPQQIADATKFLALDKQQKAQAAAATAAAKKGASGGKGGTPLGVSGLTPQEYNAIVDGIGTNTLDASQMLRYGKADQLKILADVKTRYPQYDATQYGANLGLQKWATSGKGADQIQSLNTLHGHTADFLANMNSLGNVDSSLLNTPINKLKLMTGNPQIVSLVGRMLAPRTEYMNLLNNNHALHDADQDDAKKLLNENMSPAQMAAAMQQINDTADIRGSQTNTRYKSVFHKDMPNYRPTAAELAKAQQPPVPGAIAGRNSVGKIIAWRLPNGEVQMVQH